MLIILAGLAFAAAETPPAPVVGRWINPSRSVIVEIAPCSDALCGTVQWATEQAKQDALKGTPTLVGTQLLTGLQQKGDLWQGKLFVPDEKLHVTAKIEPAGDQLKVSGCELGICKSQLWARAEGPLPSSE